MHVSGGLMPGTRLRETQEEFSAVASPWLVRVGLWIGRGILTECEGRWYGGMNHHFSPRQY